MAVIITEPAGINPDIPDWQNLLFKLTTTTGGLMLVDFTEKTTTNIPQIVKGSRFELNGSFYKVDANESILNWENIVDSIRCYVYLRALGNGLGEFYWSQTKPTFQVEKGGWFHPIVAGQNTNERCILSAYKQSATQCRTKAVYGIYGKQYETTLTSGVQISIANSVYGRSQKINITAGWYSITIQGGTGGNGGHGGSSGLFVTALNATSAMTLYQHAARAGNGGGSGHTPSLITIIMWLEEGTLELSAGRTGNAASGGGVGASASTTATGASKGAGSGGKGGWGADGEASYVLNNGKLVARMSGGDGGGGGKGADGAFGWYIQTIAGQSTTYALVMGTRPEDGLDGADGFGYSNTVSGTVIVEAL